MTEQDNNVIPESPAKIEIPDELPVLPLRDTVVFPFVATPLIVARRPSVQLIDDVLSGNRLLALVAQRKPELEEPRPEDIYTVGTAAIVLKMLKFPDGSLRVLVQGIERVKVLEYTSSEPYYRARIKVVRESYRPSTKIEALMRNVQIQFQKIVSLVPHLPDELQVVAMNLQDPGRLADLVASNINLNLQEKQEILEHADVEKRLERLTVFLTRELEVLELGSKIQSQVQSELGKNQREYFLREQLKAIQQELGIGDERSAEINELRKAIEEAKMPEQAYKEAMRELDRLAKMQPGAAEYTVSRTYIDWLVSLPWSISTEDNLDIEAARRVLDEDHYDLEKVKERILEYLAVRKLKPDSKGPILCFVGPPGVGKTSLGRSIARALGRKFVRMSLGGVRDEAEIRGHRRTYIGALPGRIIQGLKNARANNPVFMLDEVDKIGADFRGDPSSALLEVLDPEQNFSFSDHYLEVPFDLSKVMFITTANVLDTIPPALRDRMEVLELPGYIAEEKLQIAFKYLIPRQIEENGLKPKHITFTRAAVRKIIQEYTREAGVRNLEREIASICRKVAKDVAAHGDTKHIVTPDKLQDYLGPAKYFSEVKERTSEPGVATGLAWTPVGGDILFVEATKMRGSNKLTLTGQLGEVMRESAQAALSYVRSRAAQLGIQEDVFEKYDIHVHVPEGAIPKDGPSAGVTIATSLVSLLTDRPIRSDIAMTGEITLRGKVLPVGGIKEKVLAARRAGIRHVILPRKNEKDLAEIPEELRKEITFYFVDTMDQVLELALRKNGRLRSRG
ncbi:MAG: endopeptidase La [candidate division KSB1 bacterium]|nr:endopeptidase La [candidate division KSB1 bacterium]MDZ7295990.1 endopeptidase La [candidate division KSB1 bacterium]MDZ7337995.1 endopeptidase La [candidate division KSB1 bacterium]MDZ7384970.1 endopeptidase La [candidate division KSB1 bacterium]MDZ7391546.1 endopeptidase La [candidate division KSB1 bacterium]